MTTAELQPMYLLDETWDTAEYIGPGARYGKDRRLTDEEEKVRQWIRNTRIQVAEIAETTMIRSKENHDYLLTKLEMNIILPKGIIEELRFKATLKGDGEVSNKVYAHDGFPKDIIVDKYIVEGKVTLGVTKLLNLVPVIGDLVPDLELKPKEFKLGKLRQVQVDFSGSKTPIPEWYLSAKGIKNELSVALIIAKLRGINRIEAEIQCAWIYNPGILSKTRVGTDEKTILIYGTKHHQP